MTSQLLINDVTDISLVVVRGKDGTVKFMNRNKRYGGIWISVSRYDIVCRGKPK